MGKRPSAVHDPVGYKEAIAAEGCLPTLFRTLLPIIGLIVLFKCLENGCR